MHPFNKLYPVQSLILLLETENSRIHSTHLHVAHKCCVAYCSHTTSQSRLWLSRIPNMRACDLTLELKLTRHRTDSVIWRNVLSNTHNVYRLVSLLQNYDIEDLQCSKGLSLSWTNLWLTAMAHSEFKFRMYTGLVKWLVIPTLYTLWAILPPPPPPPPPPKKNKQGWVN